MNSQTCINDYLSPLKHIENIAIIFRIMSDPSYAYSNPRNADEKKNIFVLFSTSKCIFLIDVSLSTFVWL